MNQTYNTTNEIKKGFKTFVLTLSISLIVFSVAYFMLSNDSYAELDSLSYNNNSNAILSTQSANNESQEDINEIIQIDSNPESIDNTQTILNEEVETQEATVFGKIASADIEVNSRAVLAETDTNIDPTTETMNTTTSNTQYQTQVTTPPVPDAGVTEMTWGLVLSMIAFLLGFIVISKDPRNIALKSFEKDMMR